MSTDDTRDVTVTLKFRLNAHEYVESRRLDGEHELPGRLQTEVEALLAFDWPGEGHAVAVTVAEVTPAPPVPPHQSGIIAQVDDEWNESFLAGCNCGWRCGIDGVKAEKPFRDENLARRVADMHVWEMNGRPDTWNPKKER